MAAGDLAINNMDSSRGAYPLHDETPWCPDWEPHGLLDMMDCVPVPHLDPEVAGAGVFTHGPASLTTLGGATRRIEMDDSKGSLQAVQTAEFWVSRHFPGNHVGIDNLNVLGGVARLLEQAQQGNSPPPCSGW